MDDFQNASVTGFGNTVSPVHFFQSSMISAYSSRDSNDMPECQDAGEEKRIPKTGEFVDLPPRYPVGDNQIDENCYRQWYFGAA
jgi:hypothetical protein